MFKELARLISRLQGVPMVLLDLKFQVTAHDAEILEGLVDLMGTLNDKPCQLLHVGGWNIGLASNCDIPSVTTLERLQLRFARLCPSFQDWAIRSMNSSLITHLLLDDLSYHRNSLSFNQNLHLLALPVLRVLTIRSRVPVPFRNLSAFLCRHPRIEDLALGFGDHIMRGPSALAVGALPILSTLCSTPRYISHFLSHGGSLPNLVCVKIHCFLVGNTEDYMVDVDECLLRLAPRRKINSLRFSFPPNLREWFTNGSHPRHGQRRDVERTLRYIKYLCLTGFLHRSAQPLLPHWLSLFPSLRRVDFRFCNAFKTAVDQAQFRVAIALHSELDNLQILFFGEAEIQTN